MSWADDLVAAMKENDRTMSGGGLIKVAVMTGPNTVRIGNLDLLPQDLFIPDRLLVQTCTKVSEVAPSNGGTCTDKSTYSMPLKAGDLVLVYQLSDDRFAILERVVSGA